MTTKSGSLYVGRRAAENALHAIRFANECERPMNVHITVNFTTLGVADEDAGAFFQDFQSRISRWWRDQRVRKGQDIGQMLGFHVHANPAGSRHVHWVCHVPDLIKDEFKATLTNRLQKLSSRIDLGSALDIGDVSRAGSLAKYILRGIEPEYADYLHIEAANDGLVRGCRRSGVTRAAGKTARQKAGWVRKRRPRNRPNH